MAKTVNFTKVKLVPAEKRKLWDKSMSASTDFFLSHGLATGHIQPRQFYSAQHYSSKNRLSNHCEWILTAFFCSQNGQSRNQVCLEDLCQVAQSLSSQEQPFRANSDFAMLKTHETSFLGFPSEFPVSTMQETRTATQKSCSLMVLSTNPRMPHYELKSTWLLGIRSGPNGFPCVWRWIKKGKGKWRNPYLLSSQDVESFLDFGERSFSEGFAEEVVADLLGVREGLEEFPGHVGDFRGEVRGRRPSPGPHVRSSRRPDPGRRRRRIIHRDGHRRPASLPGTRPRRLGNFRPQRRTKRFLWDTKRSRPSSFTNV